MRWCLSFLYVRFKKRLSKADNAAVHVMCTVHKHVLLLTEQMGIADLALLPGNGFRFPDPPVIRIHFLPHRLSEITETDLVVSELVQSYRSHAGFL